MGYYCTVPQCTSLAGKTKNVKFHRFPRDITMANKWNVILKRGKPYTKYSKVCSLHFTQSDYNVTTMGQWKTLSKDAVPSQNLPKLHPDGTVMVIRKSRTVKYREGRKDSTGDKCDKWCPPVQPTLPTSSASISEGPSDHQDHNIAYRLQALSAIASTLPPQNAAQPIMKPKKQDAFMQTDPVQSEEDDLTQPNNSYSETSDNSYNSEQLDYSKTPEQMDYSKSEQLDYSKKSNEPDYSKHSAQLDYSKTSEQLDYSKDYLAQKDYSLFQKEKDYVQYKSDKKYDNPKDYTKQDDYMPQTNEEYNKEAEKYALERKALNGYEKHVIDYQKSDYQKSDYQKSDYQKADYQKPDYQKPDYQKPDYQKPLDGYQMVPEYMGYPYPDSVEILRNQQHNLEMLQQQHRVNENQNFFNESHIKQEVDINSEEEKFLYERAKDQLDANTIYGHRSVTQQRLLEHLQHQVKQEPETGGCDNVIQPQGSPYYASNGHNNAGGYYDQRPGPELLIAKQNALAAHTQLWQNTMKRPFFYSETPHYPTALHRYEDLTRILQ